MSAGPGLLGIVNITEDSFSDGGAYLAADAAIAHAQALSADGADIVDLGAAASNPDAKPVPSDLEIARLAPVVAALDRTRISVDSCATETQRWALAQGVGYLNDIGGFATPCFYPELAAAPARLIVMHSIRQQWRATHDMASPDSIFDRMTTFFRQRLAALTEAGIARARLILDPGMGFFLGANGEASLAVLRRLPELKAAFGLPVLVSVSRKSFLRQMTGRDPTQAGAATLAAELFAARQGADYIRTHDPGALRDALHVWRSLDPARPA